MKLNRQERSHMFGLIVDPMPTPARRKMLLDKAFCAQFGIHPKSWFSVGGTNVETGSLHRALSAAAAGRKAATLELEGGDHMRVKVGMRKDGQAVLQLKGNQIFLH